MKTVHHCLECGKTISHGFFEFSTSVYRFPLCIHHLFLIEERGTSHQTLKLYFALKDLGFPVVLEYFDGHTYTDIAIPGRLNIEVNNPQPEMVNHGMSSLSRSVHSLQKNIPTIMISENSLKSARGFSHAVTELSKACRLMHKPSVSVSLAQSLTAAQLQ